MRQKKKEIAEQRIVITSVSDFVVPLIILAGLGESK